MGRDLYVSAETRLNVAGDGLSDEQGPIPAFGPVETDEHGRIVMSDEEAEARRAAAARTMKAIGNISDETDVDAVWDDVFRGLKGAG
jgi:hypothetical protein